MYRLESIAESVAPLHFAGIAVPGIGVKPISQGWHPHPVSPVASSDRFQADEAEEGGGLVLS